MIEMNKARHHTTKFVKESVLPSITSITKSLLSTLFLQHGIN